MPPINPITNNRKSIDVIQYTALELEAVAVIICSPHEKHISKMPLINDTILFFIHCVNVTISSFNTLFFIMEMNAINTVYITKYIVFLRRFLYLSVIMFIWQLIHLSLRIYSVLYSTLVSTGAKKGFLFFNSRMSFSFSVNSVFRLSIFF